jgi:tetratricopeptide (TPR) repeat protein
MFERFRKTSLSVTGVLILVVSLSDCRWSPAAKEAAFMKRGESLLAHKDYSRALLEFKNAASVMPGDAEPYYRMGLVYLEMRDLANAIPGFRRATQLNPNHTGAQLKLAQLMTTSRNQEVVQEAVTRLQSILTVSPDNTEAIDVLAMAESRLGRTADAEKRLEEALQKFPAHLQTSVALARLKVSHKDLSGAAEVLKKAVASAPQSAPAAVALGEIFQLLKQPENAEREMRRALELDAQNGPALLSLAAIQMAGKRLDEAEQTFKQLSTLPAKAYRPLYGLFLYQTGRIPAALEEFDKQFKAAPDDREARGRLIAAYIGADKIAEAKKLLASVLKKNPKDADTLLQKSELNLKSGQIEEAEKDLKVVLDMQPNNAKIHFALAGVYKAKGLEHTERLELDEALRLDNQLLPARLELARSLIAANQAKTALGMLDETPAPQRRMLGWITERNWALLATGNFGELRGNLDQALRVGRLPELLIQSALVKMAQGDHAGARADAEEVLQTKPEEARAARIVADSYAKQKQMPKAIERVAQLVAAHPQSAPLQYLLGQLYLSSGGRAEARQAFEAALSAAPRFFQADLTLAEMDRRENRIDAAKQRLTGVVTADPGNIPALEMLAGIEREAGEQDSAIGRYRKVLDIDSSNLLSLNNLAYMLASVNVDEALKFAQKAAEIAPDNAAVEDTLGWVYYRRGIYNAAVGYLKKAVAKEPTPRRQFHLAMSYLKLGDQDVGQKMLRTALQQDPNLPKTEKAW